MTEFSDTPPAGRPADQPEPESAEPRAATSEPASTSNAEPAQPEPPSATAHDKPAGSTDDTAELPPPPPPFTGSGAPTGDTPSGAPFAARYGLIRPRSGRYLAGVSGAVARATNTDPVLWRVLFVVLAFFGGFGILAYLVLWLGTPAEGDTASPVEAVFGRGRSSTSATLTVIVGVITALILFGSLGDGNWGGGWVIVALIVVGVIVYYSVPRRNGRPVQPYAAGPYPPPTAMPYTASVPTTGGPTAEVPPGYQPAFAPHGPYSAPIPPVPPVVPGRPIGVKPPKPPKEHSRLGGLIMSVTLVVLGIMGLLDVSGVYDLTVGAYFAAALVVIGLGLVLGAFLGRARGMIFWGLILCLALAITGFSRDITFDDPRNGGGDITWEPQNFGELQDSYSHQFGTARLDLSQLDFTGHDTTVHLKMQAGDLRVIVPPNVDVTTQADVRLGSATIFDRNANGARISDFTVTDLGEDGKEGGGTLHLDIQVSLGNAEVTR